MGESIHRPGRALADELMQAMGGLTTSGKYYPLVSYNATTSRVALKWNLLYRVHPVDGSIHVWRNNFEAGPGRWIPYERKLALGVGLAGSNIHFAHINNELTGRADYIAVRIFSLSCTTGKARTTKTQLPRRCFHSLTCNGHTSMVDTVSHFHLLLLNVLSTMFWYIVGETALTKNILQVEPSSGGLRVWLNGCNKLAPGSGKPGGSGQGGR